jgi:L-arabinose isomerase
MTQQTTSFDSAQQGVFGDILNARRQRGGRIRVGLIGCGYFEYWRMYPALREKVEGDLAGVHARLAETLDIVYPVMVDTLDAAEAAGRTLADAGVQAVIVVEGTYLPDFMVLNALEYVPNAQVILFDTQTGSGMSADDVYEDTLRNSALIGVAQLSGTFRKSGRPYKVVVGEISEPDAYRQIARLVRSREIAARLRTFNIGLVGHVFRGMFDLEFDRGAVRGCLGPEVISIQAEHLVDLWREIPETDVLEAVERLTQRFRTRTITHDDIRRSVRLGLAMRQLTDRYRLDALCFLGQHYLEKMTHAPARLGASMMMEDDRMMVACEGDVGGLITMQILHELTGHAPVQMEWGQFDAKSNAVFLLGHGIASPEVASAPEQVTLTRAPEEWGFEGHGVSWEMMLRPGVVTMGHFLATPDGWRMLISSGESLSQPCLPCDEIHGLVRVDRPVREYLQTLLEHGIAHHVIVAHDDVVEELEMVADAMGVQKLVVR